MMRRGLALFALLAFLTVSLTGCWDYRGINEIAVVMGMAVDHDEATGMYKVSFEIADLANSSKDSGIKSRMIETEGTTIFEAVRSAKRKLINKLYFSNMEVVVIGEKMARDFGIMPALDWFMRDGEVRETVLVLIAKGTDAHALLNNEGIDQTILSPELQGIIQEDNKVTSSIVSMQLFDVYSALSSTGIALTLPAFSITVNDKKPAAEADGVAIFNGDKLVGFLSADETKFLLLAEGKAQGGILAISASGSSTDDTSLEIAGTKSDISYELKDGVLTMSIKTETSVLLGETACKIDIMDNKQIKSVEERAGEMVSKGITDVIMKEQALYGDDILGLGAMIHKKDFKLWHSIKDNWPLIYPAVRVVVKSKVHIVNTSMIKAKEAEIK